MQIKKLEARANFSLVERLKARKNLANVSQVLFKSF
jgi:hypothetical protein